VVAFGVGEFEVEAIEVGGEVVAAGRFRDGGDVPESGRPPERDLGGALVVALADRRLVLVQPDGVDVPRAERGDGSPPVNPYLFEG